MRYHVYDATRSCISEVLGTGVQIGWCESLVATVLALKKSFPVSSWRPQHLTISARCLTILSLADHFLPSSLKIPALCSGP